VGIPKYLIPDSPQKKGRKQEKKAMQTINSGGVWFDPADLNVTEATEKYLVDVKKVVTQKGYILFLKDIEKLHRQAGIKTPVFLIYIGDYVVKAIVQRRIKNEL